MRTLLLLILIIATISCSEKSDTNKAVRTSPLTDANYSEAYRNQFHFAPEAHWMNDPNGLVFYDGEYHLFYQYYPDSTVWGPMHWGHAISTDLINWEHLPVALYPDELGYIFSGSAVVDWSNTSGLGSKENPPLVAIYTYHLMEGEKAGNIDYQTQAIAFSLDKGRTWTKYEGNPVIPNPGIKDFRDPKVAWNEKAGKWIMSLAVLDHIRFYSSENLIDWALESDFGKDIGDHGGVWECPDLFKLPVKGTDEEKWVLLVSINPGAPNGGSGTQYFVGDFDGRSFVLDDSFEPVMGESIWIDYGTDNYAGVTWSDIPEEDGRRIFIGWMSNWQYGQVVPTNVWRSAMTVPRTLGLKMQGDSYILTSIPVSELEAIKGISKVLDTQIIEGSSIIQTDYELYEFSVQLNIEETEGFEIVFSNDLDEKVVFEINKTLAEVYFDRTKSGNVDFEDGFAAIHTGKYEPGETVTLEILVDLASMEIFVDEGSLVMTEIFFPGKGYDNIEIVSKGGTLVLDTGTITELKSIW